MCLSICDVQKISSRDQSGEDSLETDLASWFRDERHIECYTRVILRYTVIDTIPAQVYREYRARIILKRSRIAPRVASGIVSLFSVLFANYFFAFGHSKIGGGGGVGSLGLPNHTDLLKRPFITGGCHLLLHTTVAVGFSAVTVAMLTVLKR